MTVEVHTAGPGVDTWRSATFTATVDATAAYVYGYSRAARMTSTEWDNGDDVEVSWFNYGTDATASVVVSLVSGSITSANVYPDTVTAVVAAGDVTLTIPANTRCRLEVNGDRTDALHIFASPLKGDSSDFASYADLTKTASGVSTTTEQITFGAAHGFLDGQRVLVKSSTTLPTYLDATGDAVALDEHTPVWAILVDSTNIKITLTEGDTTGLDLVTAGTGTITVSPAEVGTVSTQILFPAGIHTIGRGFLVKDSASIYLEEGAVCVGSFYMMNDATDGSNGASIEGPGVLSGTYTTHEASQLVLADSGFEAALNHGCLINGFISTEGLVRDNTVKGITLINCAFYNTNRAAWSWRNVHVLSPWGWNTDGISPSYRLDTARDAEIVDCFSFVSDDGLKFRNGNVTISGSFSINGGGGSPYHGGYNQSEGAGLYSKELTDNHAMTFARADNENVLSLGGTGGGHPMGNGAIVKCWVDNDDADFGDGNCFVTINGLNVWAAVAGRFMSVGNRINPWGTTADPSADQAGQTYEWDVSNVTIEQAPGQKSHFIGRDPLNTPHDFTFASYTVAGTSVYDTNWTTYWLEDDYAYNIDIETDPATGTGTTEVGVTTFVVETGTGSATANSYCTVAAADAFHVDQGNPSAWSADTVTDADKEDALRQATLALDIRYGARWSGDRGTSAQALDWPRVYAIDGAGNMIASDSIPNRLRDATAMLALLHLQGETINPLTEASADISSETKSVGPISKSVTFRGGKPSQTKFPVIDRMLASAGLTSYGGIGWGITAL